MGQDPDSALEEFRKDHPETYDNDLFVLSWLNFDEVAFQARCAESGPTPIFKDEEFAEKVRSYEAAPPVEGQPLVQDSSPGPQDDGTVHRDNLDYVIEAYDNPKGITPNMRDRVAKYEDIQRRDNAFMGLFKKRRRF